MLSDIETYRTHPEDAWQRLKLRVKKPRQLAILQALAAWREREAQERDVPRGRVLKDEAIYEIALQQPRDAEALGRLRTIPRGFERSQPRARHPGAVDQALDAARRAAAAHPAPARRRPNMRAPRPSS